MPRTVEQMSSVSDDVFRDVIGRFATGVTIITARYGGRDYGATASAMSSLSLEPPMLLVCLNHGSQTQQALRASGWFGVNILSDAQADLARRFGGKGRQKFDGVESVRGAADVPLLPGALAHLECEVVDVAAGGTHNVFLAVVHRAQGREGRPLACYRGQLGGMAFAG